MSAAAIYQGHHDEGTTSSGTSYQRRDILHIQGAVGMLNTYKSKVHNRKIEIISFVIKFLTGYDLRDKRGQMGPNCHTTKMITHAF